MTANYTPGPWKMRPVLTLTGEYYTISRVVNRRRVHLKYASDGKQPMLYSHERAWEEFSKLTGSAS